MTDQISTNEIMEFLQEHVVTKEDLENVRKEIRDAEHHVLDQMTDEFADLGGVMVTRERKADQKVNLILDILERHQVGTSDEIARVRQMKLFPTTPERV